MTSTSTSTRSTIRTFLLALLALVMLSTLTTPAFAQTSTRETRGDAGPLAINVNWSPVPYTPIAMVCVSVQGGTKPYTHVVAYYGGSPGAQYDNKQTLDGTTCFFFTYVAGGYVSDMVTDASVPTRSIHGSVTTN
jgi:hypothetical protein